MAILLVKKLDPKAIIPTVAHRGEDLAYDLYALEDTYPAKYAPTKIRTGIAAHFTDVFNRYGLLIRDRSSVAAKGLFVVGGVIDEGYKGEIIVLMHGNPYFLAGQKIAQMIPIEVLTAEGVKEVDELPDSNRMEKGFGSSGQ